ncbi:YibE/F family protein [Candidatus Peregrinibacteria bacterium]|jgi:uncharacterized membrane protein|nr:YibE/F family protein [Candidatus Peregrinibacteria bacterium]MBT4586012.1 YibE/F family protein [Candidatus Peregrinibacteria bacterium]MBT6730849.1 YibE/F family protein [Candidatus Peregrinibacteria bacterium]MBT7344990.1 YibE/F family protein [Candidatus Peregrinibacteria bacterium]MBT7928763.1 YibE/F family protein [Candidatus Peregrinibacteria bacterium]
MKLHFISLYCTSVLITLFYSQIALAQESKIEFIRGYVQSVITEDIGSDTPIQKAKVKIVSGPETGTIVNVDNVQAGNREDLKIYEGQNIVLQNINRSDGSNDYFFQETFRLYPLLFVICAFLALVMFIGRKKGVMSIIGLLISISIIIYIIFPLIKSGWNALLVSIIGTFLIASITILVAHGFNKRSFISLISTFITLICSILLSIATVDIVNLFGLGTEESIFLKLDPSISVNPKGLFLSGIIIGALGILDDITTSQVAAIDEIRKANPNYGLKKLYTAGISIGNEHVASMINTLALAYIGASLPMFLLLSLGGGTPMWVTINSAFISEEIIRTLVGSSALLLAMPISTIFASYLYSK